MTFTVLGLQSGPNQWGKSYAERIAELNQHLEQELNRGRADLVVLPELMTVPYQCTVYDDSYFEAAEQLQGPTFQWLAEKARHYQTTLIGTIFEQATEAEGVRYYNTALVVSPEGHLVGKYRKTHIAKLALPSLTTDEKYYFSAGDELPVFTIGERKVGILICLTALSRKQLELSLFKERS